MLTKVLAMEWGTEGIRVNSVIPGPIDGTEGMVRLTPTESSRQAVIAGVPLRRYGSIDSVAGVVLPVDGAGKACRSRWLPTGIQAQRF